MAWSYNRTETQFPVLPEGQYRVRIKSAEKAQSKNSGNDMLVLQFEVSGSNTILYHYITFMDDKPEITNRMLTQFFDSFKDIPEGDLNMNNWIGKVGAVKTKNEEYNGSERAKISYFIKAEKQGGLPMWQNPDGTKETKEGWMEIPDGTPADDDLPF